MFHLQIILHCQPQIENYSEIKIFPGSEWYPASPSIFCNVNPVSISRGLFYHGPKVRLKTAWRQETDHSSMDLPGLRHQWWAKMTRWNVKTAQGVTVLMQLVVRLMDNFEECSTYYFLSSHEKSEIYEWNLAPRALLSGPSDNRKSINTLLCLIASSFTTQSK